jgi:hypothetical protein
VSCLLEGVPESEAGMTLFTFEHHCEHCNTITEHAATVSTDCDPVQCGPGMCTQDGCWSFETRVDPLDVAEIWEAEQRVIGECEREEAMGL